MAPVLNMLRTCGLTLYFVLCVTASLETWVEPWISSIEVIAKNCVQNNCKYLLNVSGGEFLGHYSWRLTPSRGSRGANCDTIFSNYEINEIKTSQWLTKVEITVPSSDERIYFCLYHNKAKNSPFGGKWVHQGEELYLEPKADDATPTSQRNIETTTSQPEATDFQAWADLTHDIDVNDLPPVSRPTRDESSDIELFVNNRYVPLNDANDIRNVNFNDIQSNDAVERSKRSVNGTEELDIEDLVEVEGEDEGDEDDDTLETEVKYLEDFIEELRDAEENRLKDASNRQKRELNASDTSDTKSIDAKSSTEESIVKSDKQFMMPDEDYRPMARPVLVEGIRVEESDKEPKIVDNGIPSVLADSSVTLSTEESIVKSDKQYMMPDEDYRPMARPVLVEGIRVEESDKEPKIVDNGIPSVLADSSVTLRLFGEGFTTRTVLAFTNYPQESGQICKFLLNGEYMVKPESVTFKSALFEITAPSPITGPRLYLCVKNLALGVEDLSKDEGKYFHQGTLSYKVLATHNTLLPLWVSLSLILVCLMFSALFSGLNLGLMSLDRTELKIISNTGTEQERKYARAIMPVRDHGNYLLCSILLGNVAVNSTFTILLDELTSGLFAVIFSTLAIVLLGEITPQAICSRHGLMVGAKSIVVTKAVMAITAPLAFPVSKVLDYLLGEEIGSVYNRERLKELVKVTTDVNDLDKDEVNIISGALELRKKTVSDVMTKLEDVFMLPISSVLDFETMSEIVKSGYSRIPVYEGGRGNIVTVLFIKDLAFVDPDDNTPLRTLCQYYQNACNFVFEDVTLDVMFKQFKDATIEPLLLIKDLAFVDPDDNTPLRTLCQYYQNPCNFVFEDVTLDVMFKQFKDGHKGHMAFVHRINNEGEGDPFYETIGLVTLEDVIEEMIQAEIVDETDVFMDNRTKRRRNRPANKLQDFAAFAERHENQRTHISPQLTLATFQFLSTSVDAFRPDTVSETVLRRLLRQDVIHHIKLKGKTKKDPSTYVFQQGKPVDYFVLILEGRVEVTVGRENLVFEAGPFTYFGVQALTQNIGVAESPTPSAMGSLQNINVDAMLKHTFIPDYSVRAITELFYLTVKRSLYLAAKRATLMEKGALSKGATNEQFDTEVDKHLCNASSANIPIAMISKKLLGKSTSTVSTGGTNADVLGSTSTVNKLLQSVDEDISITGEHKTPSRQVSPNPMPVSASPLTRASFTSRTSPEHPRNGDCARGDEQERLLKHNE